MGNISIQCSNHSCHFYNNLMPWPDNVPLIVCPICGSSMEKVSIKSKNTSATDKFDGATEIGINATKWLSEIAYNTENWFLNAEKQYPAVIAHEYKNLHTYCYREEPYAVLLSIKDNYEALMKLEVLLAFSWAARTTPGRSSG